LRYFDINFFSLIIGRVKRRNQKKAAGGDNGEAEADEE
jgi:hypothetical protein